MSGTRNHDKKLFIILVGAIIALAWLALWLFGQSPYGRFISHQGEMGHGMSYKDGHIRFIMVFVANWTLMTVAMMLGGSQRLHSRPGVTSGVL